MSKIQILKAIHNDTTESCTDFGAVYDVKDTNFESNSQLCRIVNYRYPAVYDVKDTNFESNSQPVEGLTDKEICCL